MIDMVQFQIIKIIYLPKRQKNFLKAMRDRMIVNTRLDWSGQEKYFQPHNFDIRMKLFFLDVDISCISTQ